MWGNEAKSVFLKEYLRDLVHLVIASVAVLLASLVHHLDKFGWEPWVQIIQPKKCFDNHTTFLLLLFELVI